MPTASTNINSIKTKKDPYLKSLPRYNVIEQFTTRAILQKWKKCSIVRIRTCNLIITSRTRYHYTTITKWFTISELLSILNLEFSGLLIYRAVSGFPLVFFIYITFCRFLLTCHLKYYNCIKTPITIKKLLMELRLKIL